MLHNNVGSHVANTARKRVLNQKQKIPPRVAYHSNLSSPAYHLCSLTATILFVIVDFSKFKLAMNFLDTAIQNCISFYDDRQNLIQRWRNAGKYYGYWRILLETVISRLSFVPPLCNTCFPMIADFSKFNITLNFLDTSIQNCVSFYNDRHKSVERWLF